MGLTDIPSRRQHLCLFSLSLYTPVEIKKINIKVLSNRDQFPLKREFQFQYKILLIKPQQLEAIQ